MLNQTEGILLSFSCVALLYIQIIMEQIQQYIMRKIILNLAVSLDSLIEGPQGEFDWCFFDQDYGMTEFFQRIDAIFFGRKGYEVALKYGMELYSGKAKYVFSKTLKETADEDTFIVSGNLLQEVNLLKNKSGKDIWLFGGSSLISSFINEGLVDELMLAIHPLVLGKGKPLFENIHERMKLELTDTKTFSTGLVQLFYKVLH